MFIPIGRFSRMTRLSLKALRLYDKAGLLVPAHVDPSSGYRYYKVEQAQRAEVIRLLRSVDMSLEDIRVILATDDGEHIAEQLRMHKARLAERVAEQQRKLAYLESIINDERKLKPREVSIVEADDQSVVSVTKHTSFKRMKEDVSAAFMTLGAEIERSALPTSGPPMLIYHHVVDEESEGDIEVCVPVSVPFAGGDGTTGRTLEGGMLATTEHRGPYEELAPAYQVLTAWVTEKGYEFAGSPREVYLNDPRTVPPEELVTRLEFPICKEGKTEC